MQTSFKIYSNFFLLVFYLKNWSNFYIFIIKKDVFKNSYERKINANFPINKENSFFYIYTKTIQRKF